MHYRRATGNLLAGIVLIVLGVIIAVLVYQWNAAVAPSDDSSSYHVIIDSVSLVEPVSVDNARWEIALTVRNNGKAGAELRNVYVNRKIVDEYGLEPGGSLSCGSVIGTSLPVEGIILDSNERVTIVIWIGSELFSKGNQISLHIFNPNILEYTRYLVLN
jgi:hypothetical protein